jgi:hypothetical protein
MNQCEWSENDPFKKGYDLWRTQTEQGFGTAIVLEGTKAEIDTILRIRDTTYDFCGEWVLDPTYPVKDGEVTHLIPVETCAWYFVADKGQLVQDFNLITQMPLMR